MLESLPCTRKNKTIARIDRKWKNPTVSHRASQVWNLLNRRSRRLGRAQMVCSWFNARWVSESDCWPNSANGLCPNADTFRAIGIWMTSGWINVSNDGIWVVTGPFLNIKSQCHLMLFRFMSRWVIVDGKVSQETIGYHIWVNKGY